jgi:hypothetical protein
VGGTVRTQLGLVGIDSIEPIEPDSVTEADAVAAGYRDRAGVLAMFAAQEGTCYRITLHPAGADPRDQLREAIPDVAELNKLVAKLNTLDASAPAPWTRQTLQLIDQRPATVSTELASSLSLERDVFKDNVRKLKALGLTVSLDVGYQLSARGKSVLAAI